MSMLRYILLIAATLAVFQLPAQYTRFHKSFGGSSQDEGRSVKQTFDKGYIVAGATSSFGNGNMDVFLIKTDSAGIQEWTRTYGGTNSEWGYSVVQLADSGFAIGGYTNSFGSGGYDMYLVRTDKNGTELWSKTYGGAGWDLGYSMQQTSDGGFVLAGTTYSYGAGNADVYVVKTDSAGDTLWTKTLGGAGNDEARFIEERSAGGYVLCGSTASFGAGALDIYYHQLDASGSLMWSKTLGGALDETSYTIRQVTGGYVLAGATNTFGNSGSNDFYLVKTDQDGDTLYTKTFGAWDNEQAYTLDVTSDGGYALAGLTAGSGYHNIYFFKTDTYGGYNESTSHGGLGLDDAYSIRQAADGGYVIAGSTTSYTQGLSDVYLIKTDAQGLTSPFNSVPERTYPGSLQVVPNPLSASAVIQLPAHQKGDQLVLELFDACGRAVEQRVVNAAEGKIIFDRDGLENGMYFFRLYLADDKSPVGAGKIIVQ